nr:uncharacterized protein LOC105492636 [Macaca nemestrina]
MEDPGGAWSSQPGLLQPRREQQQHKSVCPGWRLHLSRALQAPLGAKMWVSRFPCEDSEAPWKPIRTSSKVNGCLLGRTSAAVLTLHPRGQSPAVNPNTRVAGQHPGQEGQTVFQPQCALGQAARARMGTWRPWHTILGLER